MMPEFELPLVAEKARNYTLKEWQSFFKAMYDHRNHEVEKRAFNNNTIAYVRGYILAHITEDLGNLAEVTRENTKDPEKITKYLGAVFAWLFALANDLDFDLGDVTFHKYPKVCPYCEKAVNCGDSWWAASDTTKDKKPMASVSGEPPKTLADWYRMFDDIYGRKIRVAIPLHDIMHKLYEELAEIFKELNTSNLDGVKYEVPDFVSWFFAFITKMKHYAFVVEDDLSNVLIRKFEQGCPDCLESRRKPGKRLSIVCVCPLPTWVDGEKKQTRKPRSRSASKAPSS